MRNAVWPTFLPGSRADEGRPLWPKDRWEQVRAMFLICALATLLDAGGTVIHLGRGAREMNPIWAAAIEQIGAVSAMGLRFVVGLLFLGILLAFWRLRVARLGFGLIIAVFLPLTLYHLFLLLYFPFVS